MLHTLVDYATRVFNSKHFPAALLGFCIEANRLGRHYDTATDPTASPPDIRQANHSLTYNLLLITYTTTLLLIISLLPASYTLYGIPLFITATILYCTLINRCYTFYTKLPSPQQPLHTQTPLFAPIYLIPHACSPLLRYLAYLLLIIIVRLRFAYYNS